MRGPSQAAALFQQQQHCEALLPSSSPRQQQQQPHPRQRGSTLRPHLSVVGRTGGGGVCPLFAGA